MLAGGCQKNSETGYIEHQFPILRETNLETDSLPDTHKNLLLFSPFTRDGGKSNLFIHNGLEVRPYLPTGYYYVPATTRSDIKPANLPQQLLVQKGTSLSFFDTGTKTLTPIQQITVPTWAEVRSFYSATASASGEETLLISLVEKNQLSDQLHNTILYRVNRSSGEAQLTKNPIADDLKAEQNRFPIISAIYDARNNRMVQTMFQFNAGYTGVESFDLTTGQRVAAVFPEVSNVDFNGSFLTIRPMNAEGNHISIVDLNDPKLTVQALAQVDIAPDQGADVWSLYTYLNNGFLVKRDFGKEAGTVSLSILQKDTDSFKPVHNIKLPYAIELKLGAEGLYVFTSTAPGSQKYQVGIYDFASNSFSGRISLPDDVSGGETEFFE